MNNEKQYSEYKTIETVATPTFDGVSVETHPEDLLGGSEPSEPTPIALCINQTPNDELYVIGTLYNGVFGIFALKEAPTMAATVNHVGNVSGDDRINTLDDYTNMLHNRGVICSYSELSGTIAYGSRVDNWDEYEIV